MDSNDESSGENIYIAMVFTILGCFLNALSLMLMKYSMENTKSAKQNQVYNSNNPGSPKRSGGSLCNFWWLVGLICIIIATACTIISIRYGNLLLISSSSAFTMIFNTILSVTILHESFTRWDVLAIILITLGCVGCMVFTKTS